VASWLERFRDRVVHRSQVGKRRLEATFLRRELDRKLQDLGARLLALTQQGAALPQELAALLQEAKDLEGRLQAQLADIAALESER
jgi:hypothetical protein